MGTLPPPSPRSHAFLLLSCLSCTSIIPRTSLLFRFGHVIGLVDHVVDVRPCPAPRVGWAPLRFVQLRTHDAKGSSPLTSGAGHKRYCRQTLGAKYMVCRTGIPAKGTRAWGGARTQPQVYHSSYDAATFVGKSLSKKTPSTQLLPRRVAPAPSVRFDSKRRLLGR